MADLKNELTAIKILESCFAHGVAQCDCVVENLSRQQIKFALHNYLSLNKAVPIRFFKEEYRGLFSAEIRDQREALHKLKKPQQKTLKKETSRKAEKSQSHIQNLPPTNLPPPAPPVAEYYKERYGHLNDVTYKVKNLFKFVTKSLENTMYSIHSLSVMDPFKFVYEEIIKDFDQFKIEIEHFKQLMNNTVDQMIHNHQAIAKTCENIVLETRKRHKSQETYSEDGSVIKVYKEEKYYISKLNFKTKNFLIYKNEFIEILDKIITLTCDLIAHKNKINANFMEYYSSIVSPKQINFEKVQSIHTLDDMKVNNDANIDSIESYKMFRKFPQVEPIQLTIKKK